MHKARLFFSDIEFFLSEGENLRPISSLLDSFLANNRAMINFFSHSTYSKLSGKTCGKEDSFCWDTVTYKGEHLSVYVNKVISDTYTYFDHILYSMLASSYTYDPAELVFIFPQYLSPNEESVKSVPMYVADVLDEVKDKKDSLIVSKVLFHCLVDYRELDQPIVVSRCLLDLALLVIGNTFSLSFRRLKSQMNKFNFIYTLFSVICGIVRNREAIGKETKLYLIEKNRSDYFSTARYTFLSATDLTQDIIDLTGNSEAIRSQCIKAAIKRTNLGIISDSSGPFNFISRMADFISIPDFQALALEHFIMSMYFFLLQREPSLHEQRFQSDWFRGRKIGLKGSSTNDFYVAKLLNSAVTDSEEFTRRYGGTK